MKNSQGVEKNPFTSTNTQPAQQAVNTIGAVPTGPAFMPGNTNTMTSKPNNASLQSTGGVTISSKLSGVGNAGPSQVTSNSVNILGGTGVATTGQSIGGGGGGPFSHPEFAKQSPRGGNLLVSKGAGITHLVEASSHNGPGNQTLPSHQQLQGAFGNSLTVGSGGNRGTTMFPPITQNRTPKQPEIIEDFTLENPPQQNQQSMSHAIAPEVGGTSVGGGSQQQFHQAPLFQGNRVSLGITLINFHLYQDPQAANESTMSDANRRDIQQFYTSLPGKILEFAQIFSDLPEDEAKAKLEALQNQQQQELIDGGIGMPNKYSEFAAQAECKNGQQAKNNNNGVLGGDTTILPPLMSTIKLTNNKLQQQFQPQDEMLGLRTPQNRESQEEKTLLALPPLSPVLIEATTTPTHYKGPQSYLVVADPNYHKYKHFDPRSLYLFNSKWRIRRWLINFVQWHYFDQFMIFSIAGNSILLAITDYTDDDNLTKWNIVLDRVDRGFTGIFIFEAVAKILAFGFIIHKKSYMRDPWNVLDLAVVIISVISMIPSLPNLKSLRTMRVVRPLRSINAVPSMKRLVATLLISLPKMAYLVIFMVFCIFIFAILGMQLFSRQLYNRCRLTDVPFYNDSIQQWEWPIDESQQRLCGGYYDCHPNTYCHNLYEYQLPLEIDEVWKWDFIRYGILHLDNVGIACLSIFRVITLEGWTGVMYNYMDGVGILACLFFPMLVIIGSFFLLNLFLAVIMETFSDTSQAQKEKEQQENTAAAAALEANKVAPSDRRVEKMMDVIQQKMDLQQKRKVQGLGEAALMFLKHQKENGTAAAANGQEEQQQDINPGHGNEIGSLQFEEGKEEGEEEEEEEEKNQFGGIGHGIEQIGECGEGQANYSPFCDNPKDDSTLAHEKIKAKDSIWQKIQQMFLNLCENKYFNLMITFAIIINTICLGLDGYPTNDALQNILDIVNVIFTALFFFELVAKLVGMGPNQYIKDRYNIFDTIIVTLSIVDVSFGFAINTGDLSSGTGAISAFRAFRLIRVFKLAKSWTKLQRLIQMISKSLVDISSFSVLLFLLMFIYILLGMELFSIKMDDENSPTSKAKIPRNNFNTFFSSFIVVFTILTGENWDETMLQYARYESITAILFFISLVIVGVMIFLNLFLAILLDNFDDVEDDGDDGETLENIQKALQDVARVICTWPFRNRKQTINIITPATNEDAGERKSHSIIDSVPNNIGKHRKGQKRMEHHEGENETNRNHLDSFEVDNEIVEDEEEDKGGHQQSMLPQINTPAHEELSFSLRDAHPSQSLLPDFNMTNSHKKIPVNLEVVDEREERLYSLQKSQNLQGTAIDFGRRGLGSAAAESNRRSQENTLRLGEWQSQAAFDGGPQRTLRTKVKFQNTEHENDFESSLERKMELSQKGCGGGGSTPNLHRQLEISPIQLGGGRKHGQLHGGSEKKAHSSFEVEAYGQKSPSVFGHESKIGSSPNSKMKSFTLIMYARQQSMQIKTQSSFIKKGQCEGNSLFIFSSKNIIRLIVSGITRSKYFEMAILSLICISSILLALDNPLNDPNSFLVWFLYYADIVLTAVFAIEALFKIITFGFLFNKSKSYLRNGWNIIDFVVVIVSIISLALTNNKIKTVKILRLLRVLRPLRVISRNKGLRIGIQALFKALPNIFNVIVISLLFFVIFAIIGVNYFKGSFFQCGLSEDLADLIVNVETKHDCLNLGGYWTNADQNFDNVAQAMSTLFQMATTEGWIDMMNRGVDSVGIDMQPVRNQNIYWSLFFVLFIILGNFFILNLFAGVVVSTFNKQKQILEKSYLLTENQIRWIEQKKLLLSIKPFVQLGRHSGKCRRALISLVTNQKFEFFILSLIGLNIFFLALNWYTISPQLDDIIDYINYGFAGIYVVEAVLKLLALGPKAYFSNNGHLFDFIVVLASIATTCLSIIYKVDFGASATFIRALRTAKVFTYISFTRQIKVLFETLVTTLPTLTNIGGLLLLFLYIYSVLGVFLFAEVKLQSDLDIHANFQSFGYAFLTLIRCSTGEAWDYIMMDLSRQRSIDFQCTYDEFSYQEYAENGMQPNGCGSASGLIYFMTYYFMVPLIFLNLFIAIILEGFEQTSKKESSAIQDEDLDKFVKVWAKYDKEGSGIIKLLDFVPFLLDLGEPLGWNKAEYKDNQALQDKFLEELNLTTYSDFRELLFWDVLQGLTKMHIIKLQLIKEKEEKEEEEEQQEEALENNEGDAEPPHEDLQDGGESLNAKHKTLSKAQVDEERKIALRLELEFENLNQQLQDVSEVEMLREKEHKIKRHFICKMDHYTTGHFKAARKILAVLLRMRTRKQVAMQAAAVAYSNRKKESEENQEETQQPHLVSQENSNKHNDYLKMRVDLEERKVGHPSPIRLRPIIQK